MTPAIKYAEKHNAIFKIHEYNHDANCDSFGEEAAEKLNTDANRVFKTLVISLDDGGLAVAIVPVTLKLNLKLFAKSYGAKKASMAIQKEVERSTGYVLGGVSPLGQKRKLKTIIDESATHFDTIFVSAGKRGLELELSPTTLSSLTQAIFSPIAVKNN